DYDHSPGNSAKLRDRTRCGPGLERPGWGNPCSKKGRGSHCCSTPYSFASRDVGWKDLRRRTSQTDAPMILVDTSVIVAWLDKNHAEHLACAEALSYWAGQERLAVS